MGTTVPAARHGQFVMDRARLRKNCDASVSLSKHGANANGFSIVLSTSIDRGIELSGEFDRIDAEESILDGKGNVAYQSCLIQ